MEHVLETRPSMKQHDKYRIVEHKLTLNVLQSYSRSLIDKLSYSWNTLHEIGLRSTATFSSDLHCWQTDTFHLEAIGLGELQKILIGYESGPRWSLDKVTVRESDDATEEYVFVR